MSLESACDAVLLEILAQDPILAALPMFPAIGDPTLPVPRICVASTDEGEDSGEHEGRHMRQISSRIVLTAGPEQDEAWLNSARTAIENKLDDPSLPIAAAADFVYLSVDGRGAAELEFDTHKRVATVQLQMIALLA